jgi:hypothetical protein
MNTDNVLYKIQEKTTFSENAGNIHFHSEANKTGYHILNDRSEFSIDKMALQGIYMGIGDLKPASSA